jgi:CRISPR/Cas system CSM-associated protein Csm5 (group 7 of RAMP superfamily)
MQATIQEKKKLETNISEEYRYKNPQQNASKLTQQDIKKIIHHHQVRFIPEIQR